MNSQPTAALRETCDGFEVIRLRSMDAEVAIVPALGAKLVSLRTLPDGREWLWHPEGALCLFANSVGDSFTDGTLAGADECIPTVGACRAGGRDLPDHGEAWSQAWTLDETALSKGLVRTTLRLPISPFTITRTVRMEGEIVVLDYELTNHAAKPEPYLWALHPLLTFHEGDRLIVPEEVHDIRIEGATRPGAKPGDHWSWPGPAPEINLNELRLENDRASVKFFAGPLRAGHSSIVNERTGDSLEFNWGTEANPYLGVWLTRGGWRGVHHPAIEPTNAPCDTLAEAQSQFPSSSRILASGATKEWSVWIKPSAR